MRLAQGTAGIILLRPEEKKQTIINNLCVLFSRRQFSAGLDRLSNKESVLESVDYQLQSDDEDRDVAIIVAGAGVDPGMERIVTYLGRF